MCADENEFPFFIDEEADKIFHRSEILALNASLEHAWQAAIDHEMRDAGFALIDNTQLACLAVLVDQQSAAAYTRNGLVACHHGDGWRIYVQGTGQLLATLPEQVSIARRFVRRAEQIGFWPLAGAIDAAQQSSLRRIAREVVAEEIALQDAATLRLKAWQLKHESGAYPEAADRPLAALQDLA